MKEAPIHSLPPDVTRLIKRINERRLTNAMCNAAARSSRAIPPRNYRTSSPAGVGHRFREMARMAKPSNEAHWDRIMMRRAMRGMNTDAKLEYIIVKGQINAR